MQPVRGMVAARQGHHPAHRAEGRRDGGIPCALVVTVNPHLTRGSRTEMDRYPAYQAAETIRYAAEELRGFTDPDNPFWELTENDHRTLLPHLEQAISALGDSIREIAKATGGEYAQQRLIDSYHRLVQAKANLGLAMSELDEEPEGQTDDRSAQVLAGRSFPHGPAAGMRPGSDAGTTPERSARRKPDQSPQDVRGPGR